MSFTLGQWANDVDSPLCKWSRGGYHRQSLSWKALDIPKPLAFVALLDKLPHIYLHNRPEVTYFDNFTYQGPRAYMVFANPFMDLFQDILGFFFVDALQVGHGEASLVQGVIQDRESGCPLPDLPDFLDVLWEASVLEERYDRGHPAIYALDCKCRDFLNVGVFLDFHL